MAVQSRSKMLYSRIVAFFNHLGHIFLLICKLPFPPLRRLSTTKIIIRTRNIVCSYHHNRLFRVQLYAIGIKTFAHIFRAVPAYAAVYNIAFRAEICIMTPSMRNTDADE